MDLMLNYVMRYGSSLEEILISKLTAFYNHLVLKYPSRLIIMMPKHMKVHQVDRHKTTFEEVSIVKFDPSNSQFWNTSRLVYFLYYLSSFGMSTKHIYVDYGKVFSELDIPEDHGSVIVANAEFKPSDAALDAVKEKLDDVEGIPLYHFGAFYAADDVRTRIYLELKNLIDTYDTFVDEDTCYILLSYVLSKVSMDGDFEVTNLDLIPANIID